MEFHDLDQIELIDIITGDAGVLPDQGFIVEQVGSGAVQRWQLVFAWTPPGDLTDETVELVAAGYDADCRIENPAPEDSPVPRRRHRARTAPPRQSPDAFMPLIEDELGLILCCTHTYVPSNSISCGGFVSYMSV